MNRDEPKVTIVLPTYNGGDNHLRQSIDSCLNQTHTNIELIVVDDCSTDSTAQVIKSYHDPRLRCIRNHVNQRLPRSLNIGFAAAQGEYLTWTSDDNEFIPTAIEELLLFLRNHPHVDFVYTDMLVRYHKTGTTQLRRFEGLNLECENNVGACYLYSRKVYETIGNFDPRFEWVEDYDYWIRVSNKFQMRHYAKPLYIYGDHEQSLTHTRRYPIVMMRDILRYRHGYLSAAEFREAIRQFFVDVRANVTGTKEQWSVWMLVFDKVFGISPLFGMSYLGQCAFLFIRKFINTMLRPLTSWAKKISEQQRLTRVRFGLQKTAGNKNVLCLIPHLVMGGSEKVLWDIITGMKDSGYDFHLMGFAQDNDGWCQKFCAEFKNVFLLDENLDDTKYERYLHELISRLDIDMLMISNATLGYRCLPGLKDKFKNLKVLDVLHTEKWAGTSDKYIWAATYIDRRICISHHLRKCVLNRYEALDIKPEFYSRVSVIHNGGTIPTKGLRSKFNGKFRSQHHVPAACKIITFVGRFSAEKKPFLFIEIARALIARTPGQAWKFIMAGNGPYLEKTRNRIKDCGLQQHFILPGMLTNVSDLYWDSFLLLIVSKNEGIPLVMQEALARNVPVIATNVGAISELIQDGINGYLINLDEHVIDRFVEKITALANDQKTYDALSARAQFTVHTEFSFQYMSERYREVMSDLMNSSADKKETVA